MNTKAITTAAILLTAIPASAGSTMPSLADEEIIAPTESGWHVRAAMYGWATALDGDVALAGISAPVDLPFSDILDNLDFAFMGVVEVGKGKWSAFADLFYAELSASNSRNGNSLEVDMSQFIGNFAVAYRAIETDDTRLDFYAGVRVNSIDTDLFVNRKLIGAFSASASETWVDPIIGVRFQKELSEKFFFRAVGDVGGFGIESDFTWQAMAAFGYHINENASIALGYRGIGTDYSNGGFGYDVVSHGAIIGCEYSF